MQYDVTITNHCDGIRLELHTDLARDWVDSYIDGCKSVDDAIEVDTELGQALVEAMREHGLLVTR